MTLAHFFFFFFRTEINIYIENNDIIGSTSMSVQPLQSSSLEFCIAIMNTITTLMIGMIFQIDQRNFFQSRHRNQCP